MRTVGKMRSQMDFQEWGCISIASKAVRQGAFYIYTQCHVCYHLKDIILEGTENDS